MELNKADYTQLQSGIEKKKAKYGEKLYHYTSLNTFISMIKNREIWMSSTGSMNDRKETSYLCFLKNLDKANRK